MPISYKDIIFLRHQSVAQRAAMFPLVFLCISALEVYSLVWLGGHIGGLLTMCWVFASAGFGGWVIRMHNQYGLHSLAREMNQGQSPQRAMVDSLMVLLAGFLLILPGLFSDALGLLLLIPFLRHVFMGQASKVLQAQYAKARNGERRTIFFMNMGDFRTMNDLGNRGGFSHQRGFSHGPDSATFEAEVLPPRQVEAVVIETEAEVKNSERADTHDSYGNAGSSGTSGNSRS